MTKIKLDKQQILSFFGGITVMISVFVLTIILVNFNTAARAAKTALIEGLNISKKLQTKLVDENNNPSDLNENFQKENNFYINNLTPAKMNFSRGNFEINLPGDLILEEKNPATDNSILTQKNTQDKIKKYNDKKNLNSNNKNNSEDITDKNPQEEKVFLHYRALYNEKIKNNKLTPELKLEINEKETLIWEKITIFKINKENGIIYFLLKKQRNNLYTFEKDFTGRYQIIFKEKEK